MKTNVFGERHRVTYYETGMNDRLKLSALLNLILLVSMDQSQRLGIDSARMQSQGSGWVVVQYSMKIDRLPRTNERIRITTCSTAYNQLFANRRFAIRNATGQVEVLIDSDWVILNLRTRHLELLPPKWVIPYGGKKVAILPHLERPREIKTTDSVTSRKYRVRYQDIDMNRHVNNSRYLDWMMDMLTPGFLTHHLPHKINLKFSREVYYGTTIQSRLQKIVEPHQILTKHEIISSHQISALANVFWRI